MTIIYSFVIRCLSLAITLSAFLGNKKARLWTNGRKKVFEKIKQQLKPNEKRIWLHAASLGEFEQGRPLLESIRNSYPDYSLVLTFFSPSGFELRKNYSGADYIFYLPLDTRRKAEKFIQLIQPEMVLFIKYEYWFHYLQALKKRGIPVYLCSSIFRDQQIFFTWYGFWFRKMLSMITHFFVQNESSKAKLESIGFKNVTVTGDTRFDRVYSIAQQSKEIELVRSFTSNRACLIAGSTWGPDEELLIKYINESPLPNVYVIAPHEIQEDHLLKMETDLKRKFIRYSKATIENITDYQVLIIDNVGMLSSLYRYGQVAYIGGGFGKGIHNILEAATFGLPVIFGPNHTRFQEAVDLILTGGAFTISDYNSLLVQLDTLFTDSDYLNRTGQVAENYVKQNVGATEKIISHILK